MSKSIEERINNLKHCAELYETNGTSPLTDDEFDAEKEACQKIMPEHPYFVEVGGIAEEHIYGTKIAHTYIMGSLCKDPNADLFGEWFEKTFGKAIDKVVAILELKVDGSSFCLKYQDGKFIQGVSRGNGIVGIDYSNNVRYIRGFKDKINAKGYVEIKGEIYKNKNDFISERWLEKGFKNARNMASGSVNQKDPLETKRRNLDFVAYEVRGIDFKTETEKSQFLADNGFETIRNYTNRITCKGKTVKEIVNMVKEFMRKVDRNTLPFLVDGIVFKLDNIEWAESLGTTDGGRRPKSSRAIKFETEKKPTALNDVEWGIGRVGTLTMVGLLTPVELAGTTVSRCTLCNLKEMERLGITKLGCIVEIAKQGDIIPKVLRMIKAGDRPLVIPTECPSCESELEWDATHTTKVCTNEACPAQLDKSIEHWFKKIEVLGIGPGIIEKLTSWDNASDAWEPVECIADMYSDLEASTDTLNEVFGKKAFANILEAINSVKEMPLSMFVEALGIGKIGRMSKDLTAIAPTIKAIDALTPEDIMAIKGFGPTKAKSFVKGWKKQRSEIARLLEYIKIKKEEEPMSKKLNGQSFCITGTLSKPRNDFVKDIEGNGGKFASSVSKNLNFLICGEDCGSKKDKAEKLGVKILSENEFAKMIG